MMKVMFQLRSDVSTPIALSLIVFLSALTIIYYVNSNVNEKYANLYDYGDDLVVQRYNQRPANKTKAVITKPSDSTDQTLPSSSEVVPQQ